MVINAKRLAAILLLALLVIGGFFGIRYALDHFYRQNYPRGYEEAVVKYADEYGIDPNFIWAIIKTESDFRPDATSNVGARGLMQIMEDTFLWVEGKLPDGKISDYDQMYSPEKNIQYGAYLLAYLYREFGGYDTAAAAYHAGRTAVGKWLKDSRYSSDGVSLDSIPSKDTGHYVSKVMKAYTMYCKLYGAESDSAQN